MVSREDNTTVEERCGECDECDANIRCRELGDEEGDDMTTSQEYIGAGESCDVCGESPGDVTPSGFVVHGRADQGFVCKECRTCWVCEQDILVAEAGGEVRMVCGCGVKSWKS